MAIRRTLAQFSDEIVAADLADGSITAAKVAADVATQAELDVVSTAVDNVDVSTAMKPHIRTGVLQPAVAGKLLNGATHSGAYGTAQTQSGGDGHSYYYTDIKGSKPIKDPRIGGHFGSQRYQIKSRQLLEQETATHGDEIYSFDGREFFRGQCPTDTTYENTSNGQSVYFTESSNFIEITGYFNAVNWMFYTATQNDFNITIDGNKASQTPIISFYNFCIK